MGNGFRVAPSVLGGPVLVCCATLYSSTASFSDKYKILGISGRFSGRDFLVLPKTHSLLLKLISYIY